MIELIGMLALALYCWVYQTMNMRNKGRSEITKLAFETIEEAEKEIREIINGKDNQNV